MDIREIAKPLPNHLVQRYKGWHATSYAENQSWFTHLAQHGQNPRAMLITCCDSRLHISNMFGIDSGEIFIHRNIANLIPPYAEDDSLHGTSAAIEYAVKALGVANLIVVGHSQCGGVEGAYKLFHEKTKLETKFIEPWLQLLRPGYESIAHEERDRENDLRALEKQSVVISLQNLMTFPFVAKAVQSNQLMLHGLWHDIGSGILHQYNGSTAQFETL